MGLGRKNVQVDRLNLHVAYPFALLGDTSDDLHLNGGIER